MRGVNVAWMDHALERRYFVEKCLDFIRALERFDGEISRPEENRVLFSVGGRMFETLLWIDDEFDLITVTTRTKDIHAAKLEDAVASLQSALQICWDHCVSVTPVESRYDISMALFIGGFTFDAFEGVVFNLVYCAEAIEKNTPTKGQP
jgi:hypothetical protein